MDKSYLTTKWSWIVLLGGGNAKCPLSGKFIGHGGELHHILGRFSSDKTILALASDPLLTILLHSDVHREYHDRDTTTEQKDTFFQKVYQTWALHYGTVQLAYEAVIEAYMELQGALTVKNPYRLPTPSVQVAVYDFQNR